MKGLKVLLFVVFIVIYIGLITMALAGRTTMDGLMSNIVICTVCCGMSYMIMRTTIED